MQRVLVVTGHSSNIKPRPNQLPNFLQTFGERCLFVCCRFHIQETPGKHGKLFVKHTQLGEQSSVINVHVSKRLIYFSIDHLQRIDGSIVQPHALLVKRLEAFLLNGSHPIRPQSGVTPHPHNPTSLLPAPLTRRPQPFRLALVSPWMRTSTQAAHRLTYRNISIPPINSMPLPSQWEPDKRPG
jgi:hypothetical protein